MQEPHVQKRHVGHPADGSEASALRGLEDSTGRSKDHPLHEEKAAGLAHTARPALQETPVATGRGTFYLETFGCQMNEHDSEKVAGVLLAQGYKQVERPDLASVILYNTCSIREKAAQKVFSRLGEWRPGEFRSQSSVISSQFQRRAQDPPSEPEGGAPGSTQKEEAIPQGLKPTSDGNVMSELKLRPPIALEQPGERSGEWRVTSGEFFTPEPPGIQGDGKMQEPHVQKRHVGHPAQFQR